MRKARLGAGGQRRSDQRERDPQQRAPAARSERGGRLLERRIELAQAGQRGAAGDRQAPHQVGERQDPRRADQHEADRPAGASTLKVVASATAKTVPAPPRAGRSAPRARRPTGRRPRSDEPGGGEAQTPARRAVAAAAIHSELTTGRSRSGCDSSSR